MTGFEYVPPIWSKQKQTQVSAQVQQSSWYDVVLLLFCFYCCCGTDRSDVRQGEGSPAEVDSSQLPGSSEGLQTVEFLSDLEDAEQLDVLHVGNQQTLTGVHSQADVVRRLKQTETCQHMSRGTAGLQKDVSTTVI